MPRSKPSDPTGEIAFQPLTRADLPLIARWLEQAHVRRWWGDPSNELALIEADSGNAAAIAAYAKAGFRAEGVRETAHGPVLLMVRVPG